MFVLQDQNSCVGEQATSIAVDVDYELGSVQMFSNITTDSTIMCKGISTISVHLPDSASGSLVTSVITLTNSAGSAESDAIYTRMYTTLNRPIIFNQLLYDV